MLTTEFLHEVLDLLEETGTNFHVLLNSETSYQDQSVSDRFWVDRNNVKELNIEISLPSMARFETELYFDHIIAEYDQIPFTSDISGYLTLELTEVVNIEDIKSVIESASELDDYPDVSHLPGYFEAYIEKYDEALRDYALDDFMSGLADFVKSIYPLADLDSLSDFEESDWLRELFDECLTNDFIESDSFVFMHNFVPHKTDIINILTEKLGIIFANDIAVETDTLIEFGDDTLYCAMPLKSFTLVQLSNIVWLQNNKAWSGKNLVFISNYGFYIKINKYTYQVINAMDSDEILHYETFKKMAFKLANNETSWRQNWQSAINNLSQIEGCKVLSKHFRHSDKYDVVAKDIFHKFVDLYPELCSMVSNWKLAVDTDVVVNDKHRFDRIERELDDHGVTFDFQKAITKQSEQFPDFPISIALYINHKLSLSE